MSESCRSEGFTGGSHAESWRPLWSTAFPISSTSISVSHKLIKRPAMNFAGNSFKYVFSVRRQGGWALNEQTELHQLRAIAIFLLKAALCRFVEEVLIRRERSSLADFLMPKPARQINSPCFQDWINKLTSKTQFQTVFTLTIFGGPCHLSSFRCSVDFIFLWEQLFLFSYGKVILIL